PRRRTLRSLADALAKLQEFDGLADDDLVEIKTWGLTLPDGRSTGFVVILGSFQADDSRWIVRMPSSGRFVARTTLGEKQSYDITVLDDATGDDEATCASQMAGFCIRSTSFRDRSSDT